MNTQGVHISFFCELYFLGTLFTAGSVSKESSKNIKLLNAKVLDYTIYYLKATLIKAAVNIYLVFYVVQGGWLKRELTGDEKIATIFWSLSFAEHKHTMDLHRLIWYSSPDIYT